MSSPNKYPPEVVEIVAEEARIEYAEGRRIMAGRYEMASSICRLPVWRKLAQILIEGDITAKDWIRAQFDFCPGGSPFVQGLASEAAAKNFHQWKKTAQTDESHSVSKINYELLRAKSIAQNIGLGGLDGFFLDMRTDFMALTRCVFCSDQVFDSVANRFGKACRNELESDPSLLRHITLQIHESRLQGLRKCGIV